MQTTHRLYQGDARELEAVDDASVDLVVTSPPYPMVEMWDESFTQQVPAVGDAIAAGDGRRAFELMHGVLDDAWDELERVVTDGGLVCINVGDATRSVDGDFRIYSNHARILTALQERGFVPLPGLLWRKPTNAATKFMGSGMVPPNAYPTLEHEHVLVCRNGSSSRSFPAGDTRRYESAYFWEERNTWFSDLWTEVMGADQTLSAATRERSGAFPLEIPYRLINMFSIYGDTVLDPFCGTGTTALGAMLAGRHSIGIDTDPVLLDAFGERLNDIEDRSESLVAERLEDHRSFVADHRASGGSFEYRCEHHDVPVKTRQERDMQLRIVDSVEPTDVGYTVSHVPYQSSDS